VAVVDGTASGVVIEQVGRERDKHLLWGSPSIIIFPSLRNVTVRRQGPTASLRRNVRTQDCYVESSLSLQLCFDTILVTFPYYFFALSTTSGYRTLSAISAILSMPFCNVRIIVQLLHEERVTPASSAETQRGLVYTPRPRTSSKYP
jgi:hypothetical protein